MEVASFLSRNRETVNDALSGDRIRCTSVSVPPGHNGPILRRTRALMLGVTTRAKSADNERTDIRACCKAVEQPPPLHCRHYSSSISILSTKLEAG
jgi:hypothetical protein